MDLFEMGEKVRAARAAKGMTQGELAEVAGISRVRINQFENGSVFNMHFGTVMSILTALDLTLRVGDFNAGRPTLDDLQREAREESGPDF